MHFFTGSVWSLTLFLLISGCAKETKLPMAAGSQRNGSSDSKIGPEQKQDVKETVEPAAPAYDWTIDQFPMSDKCAPPAGLGFRLADGLSENNRYLLARFAKLGSVPFKFDQSFLSSFLEKGGFKTVRAFENKQKGVQGFTALGSKMNLVVFRGTHSSAGVTTDLNFFMSGSSFGSVGGGVHAGFKSAYDTVKAQISSDLGTESAKKLPTFFIGHSLGGALSMLAAADALSQGVNVAGLLTLGQPRTGNVYFAANFSSVLREKYFRYVHANDPVPHLPPAPGAASDAGSAITGNELLKLGIQASALFRFGHVGVPQKLGNAPFAAAAYTTDDVWDKSFWSSNKAFGQSLAALASGGDFSSLGSTGQNNIVADHEVEKYLCEMVRQVK